MDGGGRLLGTDSDWEATPGRGNGVPVLRDLTLVFLSAALLAAAMTFMFVSMRGILDLGGFVARGGPYEIAHPAPDFALLIAPTIWLGMGMGALHAWMAARVGGFNLVLPAWSALFLSLGWNFLEYGIWPPEGTGSAWGWLICAVVFFIMGLAAVPGWLPIPASLGMLGSWGSNLQYVGGHSGNGGTVSPKLYALLHVVAIPAGILAGWAFFRWVAG